MNIESMATVMMATWGEGKVLFEGSKDQNQ